MADLEDKKKDLFDTIYYNLGGEIVDNELEPNHYEFALKQALENYRQRSANAQEESYVFLKLIPDVNEYQLPDEIMTVQQIFRRTLGSTSSSSTVFEPFEAGYINMYMLQAGRIGGLLNYELYAHYQEIASRMFGGYINFNFNRSSKKLTIMRRPRSDTEEVLLWVHNYKPDLTLLQDHMAYPWIRDYTQAYCKRIIGEAREKFATIAGPGGGTTLNGATLKAEAQAEFDRLNEALKNFEDGGSPTWFVIG